MYIMYTINHNSKIKNRFFIRFSTMDIFHVNMATSDWGRGVVCIPWLRKTTIFGLIYRGRAISAPPIRRWTTERRAVSAPEISAPFPNFYLFFGLWRKNNKAGNFLNAIEREPVETRVLNPTASEASYKLKQRSYRKTNIKKKVLVPDNPGTEMSSAKTAAPNRRRRNVPDPDLPWIRNRFICNAFVSLHVFIYYLLQMNLVTYRVVCNNYKCNKISSRFFGSPQFTVNHCGIQNRVYIKN